jgi:hypothetical protein
MGQLSDSICLHRAAQLSSLPPSGSLHEVLQSGSLPTDPNTEPIPDESRSRQTCTKRSDCGPSHHLVLRDVSL